MLVWGRGRGGGSQGPSLEIKRMNFRRKMLNTEATLRLEIVQYYLNRSIHAWFC